MAIDNISEEWRDAVGFPTYEVSNLGRVRRSPMVGGKRGGKIIKPTTKSYYGHVSLCKESKIYTVTVHKMVCEAFIGPKPSEDFQAAHLDGDPKNNCATNLMWCTAKENQGHRVLHGTDMRGEKHHARKLTNEQVNEIRKLRASGMKLKDIGEKYGVSRHTAGSVSSGNSWTHDAVDLNLIEHSSVELDNSGARNGMAKLTKDDVLRMRQLSKEGVKNSVLAEQFGIRPMSVYHIVTRRSWAWLPDTPT